MPSDRVADAGSDTADEATPGLRSPLNVRIEGSGDEPRMVAVVATTDDYRHYVDAVR